MKMFGKFYAYSVDHELNVFINVLIKQAYFLRYNSFSPFSILFFCIFFVS